MNAILDACKFTMTPMNTRYACH